MIVAPLLDLLLAAHRTDPNLVPAEELRRRLRWLTAFAADQPDVRMASVPIRHWDGYWFGVLQTNLASFGPDGSASCAFVYPSCVNGQPAHVADPLANDQDWALVYALRHGLGPDDH